MPGPWREALPRAQHDRVRGRAGGSGGHDFLREALRGRVHRLGLGRNRALQEARRGVPRLHADELLQLVRGGLPQVAGRVPRGARARMHARRGGTDRANGGHRGRGVRARSAVRGGERALPPLARRLRLQREPGRVPPALPTPVPHQGDRPLHGQGRQPDPRRGRRVHGGAAYGPLREGPLLSAVRGQAHGGGNRELQDRGPRAQRELREDRDRGLPRGGGRRGGRHVHARARRTARGEDEDGVPPRVLHGALLRASGRRPVHGRGGFRGEDGEAPRGRGDRLLSQGADRAGEDPGPRRARGRRAAGARPHDGCAGVHRRLAPS